MLVLVFIELNKTTYGNTDIYIERGYIHANTLKIKDKISLFNRNNPEYLAVGKIFALTNTTYDKMMGTESCGLILNRTVTVRNSGDGCNNIIGSLVHELGHGIDYMSGYVTKSLGTKYDLRDYSFSYGARNTTITNYYNNYKSDNYLRKSYLREYAFSTNEEFWADLFSYQEKGFNIDSTLRNIRNAALNRYSSLYNNNKKLWNEIKEQYR